MIYLDSLPAGYENFKVTSSRDASPKSLVSPCRSCPDFATSCNKKACSRDAEMTAFRKYLSMYYDESTPDYSPTFCA